MKLLTNKNDKMKKTSLSLIMLICCTFLIFSCKKSDDKPQQVNRQPAMPSSPIPSDAATGVSVTPVISWLCSDPDGGDSLKYDIYFGSTNPPNSILASNWKQPNYALSTLDFNKTYYWRVTAHDLKGASSVSPIWRFNTLSSLPVEGLVAYYPFNGNANDESGNGNNGTVYSAGLTADRFGNANSAYTYNGINNYIATSNSGSLTISGDITISVWVYDYGDNLMNTYHTILSKRNSVFWSYNLTVSMISGGSGQEYKKVITSRRNPGPIAEFKFSNDTLNFNKWNNITVTVQQNTIRFYKNGSNIGYLPAFGNYFSIPIINQPVGLTIGWNNDNGNPNEYMWGKLDDIRIYNRALLETEILQLYHEGGWIK